MSVNENLSKENGLENSSEENGPGLLESYGSFPVWLLKLISLITPGFLKR